MKIIHSANKKSLLQIVSVYAISFIYLFDVITISFLLYLVSTKPAFAALPQPVPLSYSCQSGYSYTNGKCYKYQNSSPTNQCKTAGYSVTQVNGLDTCAKTESRNTINACPADGTNWLDIQQSWDYHDPIYPQYCSARTSSASAGGCPAGTTTFSGGICFKLQTPLGKTCPDEGGAAEPVQEECPQTYQDLGICSAGEQVTLQLPDQQWAKISEATCQRTLYEAVVKTCPAGTTLVADDTCQKVSVVDAIVGCPSGYHQDGAQCYPGPAPSCPAGTTYQNGSCVAATGQTQCASNKVLDPITGTCVTSHDGLSDEDYYMQLGADLGNSAIQAATLPTSTSTGTRLSYRNVGQSTFTTSNMSDGAVLGLDSNNGYNVSASNTYMNEDAQQTSIADAVKRNNDYGKADAVVGATEEETNDLQDHSADAYLTLVDIQNSNPPQQIGSDSSFLQAGKAEQKAIVAGTGGRWFGDCTSETVTQTVIDDSQVVKTNVDCFKPNHNNLSSCNRERTLTPPNEKKIFGGEGQYSFCGKRCINIKLGIDKRASLDSGGQCKLFKNAVQFRLMDGLHITKATIGSVRYDDQYWLKVNDETLVKRVSGSFPGGFPSESTTDCEQGQENLINVATDVTSEFQSALSQSTILNINQVVAVDGKGDGFADITLQFDQDVLFDWTEDVKETPDGCSAALDDPAAFCTASNWVCDARLNSDLVTDGGIINLSDIDGQSGVQSVAAQDDVIIMVLRREFDPTDATGYTSNCGNIMGTTDNEADNKNDDGMWICRQGIGFSTHSVGNSPAMYGTQVTNVLPEKSKWAAFAVRVNNGTDAEFYSQDGHKFDASQIYGGAYDSLKRSRIIIGRGDSSQDWTKRATAPLYLAHWEVMTNPTDEAVFEKLQQVADETDLVNLAPLFEGDDGLTPCMYAHLADYTCDPLKGQRLPLGGGTVGYSEIRTLGDECEQYAGNEKCTFNQATCADGWKDPTTNTCFGWNVSYTCETGTATQSTQTVENNSCFSDTACLNGDCQVKANETNGDFVQTAAMYAAINEIGNKSSCTDPNDPSTCQAFVGTEEFCGWDQLKVNDCCSTKGTDTASNLFKISMLSLQATENAVQSQSAFVNNYLGGEYAKKGWSLVKSGWNEASTWVSETTSPITEAASNFWGYITKQFSSEAEAVTGNAATTVAGEAGAATTDFFTDMAASLSTIKSQIYEYVYDMLPDAMQQAIMSGASELGFQASEGATTSEAGAQALESIMNEVMGAVSMVMMIYTIYSMVKLGYMLLTACSEDELKMGTNLKEKKCMFVRYVPCQKTLGVCTTRAHNEYCCFNSTLARIIMEQAIVQLGYTPETWHDNEECRGITLTELQNVDFGVMDFSEWIGLMSESEMFPDPSIDMTGSDNMVNTGARTDSTNRALDKLGTDKGVTLKDAFQNGSIGTNIDCSVFPRPPACPL